MTHTHTCHLTTICATHTSHVPSRLCPQLCMPMHGIPCPCPHLSHALTLVQAMCGLCCPSMAVHFRLCLACALGDVSCAIMPLSTAVRAHTHPHMVFHACILIFPTRALIHTVCGSGHPSTAVHPHLCLTCVLGHVSCTLAPSSMALQA